MKNTTFLLILAAYGIIVGLLMLVNAGGSLSDYGVTPVDQNHIAIFQYLGIATVGLGLLAYITRSSGSDVAIRNFLIADGFISIAGVIKGCYDVFIVHIPDSTYFWVDSFIRLAMGLGCVYFVMQMKKE